jgi:hypothetical protein
MEFMPFRVAITSHFVYLSNNYIISIMSLPTKTIFQLNMIMIGGNKIGIAFTFRSKSS